MCVSCYMLVHVSCVCLCVWKCVQDFPYKGDRDVFPFTSQKFAGLPPTNKNYPRVDSPHQISIPPLNNSFHVITQ